MNNIKQISVEEVLTVETAMEYREAYMNSVGAVGRVQYRKANEARLPLEIFITSSFTTRLTEAYPTIGNRTLNKKQIIY